MRRSAPGGQKVSSALSWSCQRAYLSLSSMWWGTRKVVRVTRPEASGVAASVACWRIWKREGGGGERGEVSSRVRWLCAELGSVGSALLLLLLLLLLAFEGSLSRNAVQAE